MTLALITLLLCAGLFMILLTSRLKTGTLLAVVAVGMLFLTGSGLLPQILLTNLQRPFVQQADPPQWRQTNAIILLGSGTQTPPGSSTVEPGLFAWSRITWSVERYHLCKDAAADCRLIVSGGDAVGTGKSEAEVYAAILEHLGVNARDIILESKSLNTFQNAQYTSKIIESLKPDATFLVTSGIHMRRAMLYFAHFGIEPEPVRSDYLKVYHKIVPIAYNISVMDQALHEYTGIIRYYIYNALGWNPSRTQVGDA